MRDIAISLLFIVVTLYAFRRHYVFPLIWAWLGLMNPHRLAYGFAFSAPFAQVTALLTLVVFPFSKSRRPFPICTPSVLLVVFYVWMCITSLSTFNTDTASVYEMWLKVTKVQVMLIVTLMMLHGRKQIDMLVWIIALSIGFYGVKGGIFTISRGGTSMVMGPLGTFIEGTNDIALAMMMVVPLMFYLSTVAKRRFIRWGLYGAMVLTTFAVLGTTSRGAFLAIGAMGVFFGFKSGRPVITTVMSVICLAVLASMMSDQWADKMDTILTHKDHSAQSRLYTWKMITNMVLDHPITGGGFQITTNPATWYVYATTDWAKPYAPHSIYFQALGEHGFVGLFLYLWLGVSTYRLAGAIIHRARSLGEIWAVSLMGMVQASTIGFAVGGAFVNLLNFDLPYYFVALVVFVHVEIRRIELERAVLESAQGVVT